MGCVMWKFNIPEKHKKYCDDDGGGKRIILNLTIKVGMSNGLQVFLENLKFYTLEECSR